MPLEFRCTSCSKLLRTPDESAGKKAKCPQCGAIVDVPLEPTSGDQAVPTGDVERDPFGPISSGPTHPPVDPANPYASPTTDSTPPSEFTVKGQLVHHQVNFDNLLRTSWDFFTQNMGQLALFGLVVFAINAGLQIFSQIGSMAAQVTNEPAVFFVFTVVSMVINFGIQTFVNLGMSVYLLKMARTRDATIGDMFKVGPFYMRGLILTFAVALAVGGLALLCIAPGLATIPMEEPAVTIPMLAIGGILAVVLGVILWLRWMLCYYFLVDRDATIGEALSESSTYMRGNKGTAFLLMLVVGFLGTLFMCCTLFIGQILYIPYLGLIVAMLYLRSTGQPFAEPTSS